MIPGSRSLVSLPRLSRTGRPLAGLLIVLTALAPPLAVSGPWAAVAAGAVSVPQGVYAALGDSYASGSGIAPYAPGTDGADGNGCRRSTAAYPHRVGQDVDRRLSFHACAGARTNDFYQAKAQDEPAQLDQLGRDTGLVTFSIGGNDVGFADVMRDCIDGLELLPFKTCHGEERITGRVDAALDALRGTGAQADVHSYDAILDDIGSRAPDAEVVAVGYPPLFPAEGGGGGMLSDRCEGVKKADQRWMVEKTNELNGIVQAAAQRHGALFADPSAGFAGHELCGQDQAWFGGLLSAVPFHPTQDGHAAIAQNILTTLGAQDGRAAAPGWADATHWADMEADERPTGEVAATRSGDQLSLDASGSTDADGRIVDVDWYVEHADGSQEVLTGERVDAAVPAGEPASVTAVVTDDKGLTDFVTRVVPVCARETDGGAVGRDVVVYGTEVMPVSSVDLGTLSWSATGEKVQDVQVGDVDGDGLDDLVAPAAPERDGQLCLRGALTDGDALDVCVQADS
ncbi:GDSL-type esterase/lipase family protein [uncultured Actinomyces sp.]|uniref:GDSL-type esterase/lipase family protein n=1 Tax=uncultured Actinomyces sp. TaxID=249061 RepID=UPI0028EF6AFA|nr:GDSL-type esterase/lipase family protein [uncultured Actinomyces sp.]